MPPAGGECHGKAIVVALCRVRKEEALLFVFDKLARGLAQRTSTQVMGVCRKQSAERSAERPSVQLNFSSWLASLRVFVCVGVMHAT